MFALRNVLRWQITAWLLTAAIFFLFSGTTAGVSALLGGGVCAVPAVLVVGLIYITRNSEPSALRIFVFEFVKVTLIVFGFLFVALLYKNLHWPAFMTSSITVLLSHIFALASRH